LSIEGGRVITPCGMAEGPWQVSERRGRLEVTAWVKALEEDLVVLLFGGAKPHIGAVGMAEPRPSLRDPKEISATSSVFTFLGHKEDVVAKAVAEDLAKALNRKVVVVAGMHWEGLREEEVEEVLGICEALTRRIIEAFGGEV